MKLYAVSDRHEKESTFFFTANNNKEAKKLAWGTGHYDSYIDIRCFCIKNVQLNYKIPKLLDYNLIPSNVRNILSEDYGFYPIYEH